ncbi:hypothetical protein K435DRAFT_719160 [Dendrothele bispora CBS 962.96]|uniref:Uncharacterized protein n=1 Tax=Dendrothele bispora (strain CBS 962.96) TaxID=1314807 RepID=A0A4S8MD68_DENBC|nr:hypothetical protein K435DRAFT_719160 [Dendrothele bispora CBS 962.96]
MDQVEFLWNTFFKTIGNERPETTPPSLTSSPTNSNLRIPLLSYIHTRRTSCQKPNKSSMNRKYQKKWSNDFMKDI